jgi:hypothetical protein
MESCCQRKAMLGFEMQLNATHGVRIAALYESHAIAS